MWCQVQAKSLENNYGLPLVRMKHAMCCSTSFNHDDNDNGNDNDDVNIYLYGGKSLLNQTLRDLWTFNPNTNQWKQLSPTPTTSSISNNDNVRNVTETSTEDKSFDNQSNNQCKCCSNQFDSIRLSSSFEQHQQHQTSINHHHHHHQDHHHGHDQQQYHDQHHQLQHHQSSCWKVINDSPPPLQEHTIINYRNKLYIFGGEIGYSSDETPLWMFDLRTRIWKKFMAKNQHTISLNDVSNNATITSANDNNQIAISRPLNRRSHSSVVYKNLMCIYGGYQDLKGSTSEIWTFNFDTNEWYLEGINHNHNNRHKKSSTPLPRHGHSAIVYNDLMYIYGGMNNLQIQNDFWSWNFKSKQWHRIRMNRSRNPGVRAFHSAIVVLDSMFLYGGERSNGLHSNELWRYRFANQTWEHIEIKGISPNCRTRHVAIANPFLKQLEYRLNNSSNDNNTHQWNMNSNTINKQSDQRCSNQLCSKCQQRQLNNGQIKRIRNHQHQLQHQRHDHQQQQYQGLVRHLGHDQNRQHLGAESNLKDVNNNFAESSNNDNDDTLKSNSMYESARIDDDDRENDDPNISSKDGPSIGDNGGHGDGHNDGNDGDNGSNGKDKQQVSNEKPLTTVVKMRPRRPLASKQRPYSDFYSTILKDNMIGDSHNGNTDHSDQFDYDQNDYKFKRRSIQETMSYYSLCFSTPPSTLNLRTKSHLRSSPPPQAESNHLEDTEAKHSNDPIGHGTRPDFQSIPGDSHNNNSNMNYSLTLDISSPDYEKELKFTMMASSSNTSTPSLSLISGGNGNNVRNNDNRCCNIEMKHLDMLEDYLEPEEMLEIIQTTTSEAMNDCDDNSNDCLPSTSATKSIQKTPAIRRKQNSNGQMIHQSSSTSSTSSTTFSNASSGYQSLILSSTSDHSNAKDGTMSTLNNQSISNSSSFGDHHHDVQSHHEDHGQHTCKTIENNDDEADFDEKLLTKLNCFRHRPGQSSTAPATMAASNRWEPNINDIIEEVNNLPNSPSIDSLLDDPDDHSNVGHCDHRTQTDANCDCEVDINCNYHHGHHPLHCRINESDCCDHHHHYYHHHYHTMIMSNDKHQHQQSSSSGPSSSCKSMIKSSINTDHKKLIDINDVLIDHKYPIFCMYVFGGKEDCITGILNKQSMTIWKFYT